MHQAQVSQDGYSNPSLPLHVSCMCTSFYPSVSLLHLFMVFLNDSYANAALQPALSVPPEVALRGVMYLNPETKHVVAQWFNLPIIWAVICLLAFPMSILGSPLKLPPEKPKETPEQSLPFIHPDAPRLHIYLFHAHRVLCRCQSVRRTGHSRISLAAPRTALQIPI